ncbi:DUF320 domain-containing protein [Saccharothrix sp. MB29]|nr:DUF320 domain-containing protein [Saccharothrix sp. MB29]
MLGTGIASAQENVNPDAPPNPLDAKVRVPVDVDHNNLGTPVGNRDLPTVHREIGTPSVSSTQAGRLAAPANPLLRSVHERAQGVETSGLTRGNTADADVVVPVSVCGNAVAAGGDAYTEGDCAKSVASTGDIRTDGSYAPLAGNVASAAAAVSPQVDGNAFAVLANAETRSTTAQDATAGGDVVTSGRNGSLSGNITAVQAASPVQVTNNAFAAGGNSHSRSASSNDAAAAGVLRTSGDRSTGGGNVLGVPLSPVVAVSGNGVGAAGNADAQAENSASAKAGETEVLHDYERWATTSGNDGTLAGNMAQPSLAGPVSTANNALAGVGNSNVDSASANRPRPAATASPPGRTRCCRATSPTCRSPCPPRPRATRWRVSATPRPGTPTTPTRSRAATRSPTATARCCRRTPRTCPRRARSTCAATASRAAASPAPSATTRSPPTRAATTVRPATTRSVPATSARCRSARPPRRSATASAPSARRRATPPSARPSAPARSRTAPTTTAPCRATSSPPPPPSAARCSATRAARSPTRRPAPTATPRSTSATRPRPTASTVPCPATSSMCPPPTPPRCSATRSSAWATARRTRRTGSTPARGVPP